MSITVPFVDLSWQHDPLSIELAQAMEGILHRGDFILGQAVQAFERAFAEYAQARYGVGVACGTDAVGLAHQACGIGPGDEVLLPTNTFIATLLGVFRTGAKPVLVDCDRFTALIDLEKAAEAISFYPSKNLGAVADGGMVLTSAEAIEAQLRILRNYGAPQKYVHTELGTNSRLDTLQAIILQVKLPHLDQWNQQHWHADQQYDRYFQDCGAELGIRPPRKPEWGGAYLSFICGGIRAPHRSGGSASLSQSAPHSDRNSLSHSLPFATGL